MKHLTPFGWRRLRFCLGVLFFLVPISKTISANEEGAAAQDAFITQTISLNPGWNAVFLEVSPDDGDEETTNDNIMSRVFESESIEKIWAQIRPESPVQYLLQPDELGFNEGGWKVYIPEDKPGAMLTNLFAATAGQVYLVKVSGEDSIELEVKGKPAYKPIRWQPNSFNLVGFYSDPDNPTDFRRFLNLPGGSDQKIYELAFDESVGRSQWQRVSADSLMEPGRGYYVYNDGSLINSGPLEIGGVARNGLIYPENLSILTLSLTNRMSRPIDAVSVSVGDFPLMYFSRFAQDSAEPQWLGIEGFSPSMNPGEQVDVLMGLDKAVLSEKTSGVLTIKAGGERIRLPLEATPMDSFAGLWAGIAVLDQVSYVHSADGDALEQTPAPLMMKLIVHVDENDQARLLKQVYVVRETSLDGNDNGVLITDDQQLPNYGGVTLTRGESMGVRLSSSAFDFVGNTLSLQGSVHSGLSGVIELPTNLPTHPMKHQWHLGHDDQNNSTGDVIDDTASTFTDEVWPITRTLSLTPNSALEPTPDNGLGRLTGVYEEQIHGLHKDVITVRGRYELNRINTIDVIDP
ncbi:hypothetical protein [Marinibactrum halimedae]|nr:hypothetical protein [Marinibactrum halimedae]MCD9457682.1 hypothetical protein [Marinibactrum halimedae]